MLKLPGSNHKEHPANPNQLGQLPAHHCVPDCLAIPELKFQFAGGFFESVKRTFSGDGNKRRTDDYSNAKPYRRSTVDPIPDRPYDNRDRPYDQDRDRSYDRDRTPDRRSSANRPSRPYQNQSDDWDDDDDWL